MTVPDRRAQALVPELIPPPQDIHATGPLSAREERDLARCHAARDNGTQADWMRDMALEAVVRRGLYRGADGRRTVEQYLDEEWGGISLSEYDRRKREWPMRRALAQIWASPVPDSHARALLPLGALVGEEQAAAGYAFLREEYANGGTRLTALDIEQRVTTALEQRDAAPAVVMDRLRELASPAAIPRPAPAPAPAPAEAPEQPRIVLVPDPLPQTPAEVHPGAAGMALPEQDDDEDQEHEQPEAPPLPAVTVPGPLVDEVVAWVLAEAGRTGAPIARTVAAFSQAVHARLDGSPTP
ncbi:hypothetical protein ACN20G_28090 (plasmid) [Streptomyces sp. BI20]|uniref:hypothetical protein n=1 Tax=Streptomyces sp. BI20 TaxID=3403460 RepID=UPI003C7155F6